LVETEEIGMSSLRTERLRNLQTRQLEKTVLNEEYLRLERDYLEQQYDIEQARRLEEEEYVQSNDGLGSKE